MDSFHKGIIATEGPSLSSLPAEDDGGVVPHAEPNHRSCP